MRIVVTGGAGFIGANLVHAALPQPWVEEVVVVDDLSTGRLSNLDGIPDDGKLRVLVGSVLDESLLDRAFRGASAVVHLAAVPSVPRSIADPRGSHEANATGTLCVLEAARRAGGPQVIVASSSSVYGANPTLPKHERLQPMPVSPYAVSKLAAESYTLAYGHCYDLPVLPFRFFNVFGPLQPPDHAYAAVVPVFVAAALEGRPVPIHGDGNQSRDFTYVGTVVSVLAEAVRRRVTSSTSVNLALGTRTTLLELVATLEDVLGAAVARDHHPPRAGDVRDSQADPALLRELFPAPRATPLREGLSATVAWMQARRKEIEPCVQA